MSSVTIWEIKDDNIEQDRVILGLSQTSPGMFQQLKNGRGKLKTGVASFSKSVFQFFNG